MGRLVLAAVTAFVIGSPTCDRIRETGNHFKSLAAHYFSMPEPGVAAFKPGKTEEDRKAAERLKGVKLIPLEKPLTPDILTKLGFKKTPFFTGRYADSALWLDGKGNAVVTNEDGIRVKEHGRLIEKSKDSFTIELENGTWVAYFPNGLSSSAELDTSGQRHSR